MLVSMGLHKMLSISNSSTYAGAYVALYDVIFSHALSVVAPLLLLDLGISCSSVVVVVVVIVVVDTFSLISSLHRDGFCIMAQNESSQLRRDKVGVEL